jgi:hypothetical protein
VPQQANLVAWFDPSLDGAIDFHVHPDAATGVARLYSRTASGVDKSDGAYWMGMNATASDDSITGTGIGNKKGRYPFLTDTSYLAASGIGVSMPWMDFAQNAPDDGNGNTLRSHVLPLTGSEISNAAATPMTFRSLFMALDTSAGGGNPYADTVLSGRTQAINHLPDQPWDPMIDYQMMSRFVRGFSSLMHCDKPTVVKIHGYCVAGGTDIALHADQVITASDAKIGYPPMRVWGVPAAGLWAHRLGDQRAKRLLFTGDCISGTQAADWGLAVEAP